MEEIVDQLQELSTSEDPDEAVGRGLFEELEDIVEGIDSAWDLVKMGKIDLIIDMLRSSSSLFRECAAHILGTASQNNPKCQQALLKLGALVYVTHMTVHDADPGARLNALYALSCLSLIHISEPTRPY
eukprot:TRINITY_DN28020_c0_g2_i1.p1 TRINITY_DN28020_c0_g2~~TRINITY_DN28020_c0_g2_i1.p1  ORF type:complete len:129 (-),score=48.01 TRINITY_DN28020_c0_g2_i1:81-467(-)